MKVISLKYLTGLVLAGVLLMGCASAEKNEQTLAETPLLPVQTDRLDLQKAVTLLEKKENRPALRAFLELKENAGDAEVRAEAVLGAAMALQRLGKTSGAIGVLMPAPASASTAQEARHLALLGELYLRSRAYGTAKFWLEECLKCPKLPSAPWVAAARFNLGKALISLGETGDAIMVFDAARTEFAKLGNPMAAENCASAVRQLKSIEKLSVEKK